MTFWGDTEPSGKNEALRCAIIVRKETHNVKSPVSPSPGRDSHTKQMGMLVVSLRGVKFDFCFSSRNSVFLHGTLNETSAAQILTLCPEHPKRDQNLKFKPLSDTTSIPVYFMWEAPSGLQLYKRVGISQVEV